MNPVTKTLAAVFAVAALCGPAWAAKKEGPWKSHVEFSYAQTNGNTDTKTLAGKLESSLDFSPNRYFLKALGLYGEQDGNKTASKWFVEGRYERAFTERFFGFLTADYLKDTFSGYDSRISAGPGVGYEIVKTEDHLLKGLLGLLYSWDNLTDGTTDNYASGKAAIDYTWQITKALKFKQYADYLQSLQDSKIYFVNSETGLEVKVASNISLGISYLVNYQHEPPNDLKHTDTRFLTSLIVDF
jgi:putative salt-induced outer membrane protein